MDRQEWEDAMAGDELVFPTRPSQIVVDALEGCSPGRALDLGAGEGRHAVWLASLGWRVTAVDWSDGGLAKGRRWAEAEGLGHLVEWVVADLADFAPEPGSYDLVLAAFCHLAAVSRENVEARAAAAVAPGGLFVVVGYDASNLTEGTAGPKDPTYLFTADAVAAEMAAHGLRVTRAERLRRTVELYAGEDELCEVVNVIVTAERP
jgi:SAM-dependent methyltransferase